MKMSSSIFIFVVPVREPKSFLNEPTVTIEDANIRMHRVNEITAIFAYHDIEHTTF